MNELIFVAFSILCIICVCFLSVSIGPVSAVFFHVINII